jgi:hypothetical protein
MLPRSPAAQNATSSIGPAGIDKRGEGRQHRLDPFADDEPRRSIDSREAPAAMGGAF